MTDAAVQAASGARVPAVVHVDLDGAEHIYRHHGWSLPGGGDPVFASGFPRLLDFLRSNGLRATLFAVASDLDDPAKREGLMRAVAEGHEIASHSLSHADFDGLDPAQRHEELAQSRLRLEDALGTPVTGFRCPSYQIDRGSFELLEETGYRWDSSVFPSAAFAHRLRVPAVLPCPYRPLYDSPVVELPLPGYRPLPFPFHPSYAQLLGLRYFELGLSRFERSGDPLVLLFHLIDFAEPLGAERLCGWKSRLYTLSHRSAEAKRERCQQIVDRVGRSFDFVTTEALLEAQREAESKPSLLMGISTTHETGAALFDGNRCLAAVSEERLDRVKFSSVYPPKQAIDCVIETAGVDPRGIRDVVVGGLPPLRLLPETVRGQLADTFEFHGWNDYFPHLNKLAYRAFAFLRSVGYRRVLDHLERRHGVRPRIHYAVHHLCHAASAYRTAPFDDALVVTADGVGDETSFTVSHGERGRLRLLARTRYPHSFGQFYTAGTQLLGFRANRHEGKITGLAAYGRPSEELLAKLRSTIRRSGPDFALDKRFYSEGIIRRFSWDMIRRGESLFDALGYRNYKTPLVRLLEGHSREDVAAAFQQVLEEQLLALVRPFAEQTGARNLCLAGGVFANVKANAALFRGLGFDRVYVFPHMGDGGLAPGAVLELLQSKPAPFEDVYWGPGFSDEQIEAALRDGASQGLRYERCDDIARTVSERLCENKVIARFDGRMEFGPRALGNRSILYPPTEPEANDWLNARLGRTEFMPFAPIVMAEHVENLFKGIEGAEHACKFMTIILDCTDWMKEHCPAVVHVDGTARPQFVSREQNPGVHAILSHYYEATGIPVLVNTSFNMHEEPIVCTPADAVRAYLASRLDHLAIGPYLAWIEEPAQPAG